MNYLFYFLISFTLAGLVTPLVRALAFKLKCVDVPRPPRNLHARPTAKLGGLAIWAVVSLVSAVYLYFANVPDSVLPMRFLIGTFLASCVLMIEGYLDDRYDLPAKLQWVFPAIAAIIVIASGVGVGLTFISTPFGFNIPLDWNIIGVTGGAIFTWMWLMGMMYTAKILDGLDGLVAGISTIGTLTLFLLSLTDKVNQPVTAALAIIATGALLGYLVYAFHPAKIFFGDGGSLYSGFILGILSVILGGKVATALLVMGIPILDVAFVLFQRVRMGKSPFSGDRLHLHFRLVDSGMKQTSVVLVFYGLAAMFGLTAVFLQTRGKVIALAVAVVVMVILTTKAFYLIKNKS
jgi:UDP-GlcNAc:undecaprenyl-phosphate GlcNAc-1-phosphate transferase